jgi:lysophospholipase L1-like esterase
LLARSGLTTAQTLELLRGSALPAIDLAVVVTGVNDVVDQVGSLRAVDAREAIANLLRNGAGAQDVVFCPLPPILKFPAMPQPLRWMAGAYAQRHNRAMRQWIRERSALSADVSTLGLDHVHLHADHMASDGFHPGAPVYRAVAEALAGHITTHVMPRLRLEPA